MRTLGKFSIMIGILSLFSGAAAQATPVTWTLNDVAFGDGGTVSGSFIFDAATNDYVSWSITTTATTNSSVNGYESLSGATYSTNSNNSNNPYYLNPNGFVFINSSTAKLTLNFSQPLTDAGGTIALGSTSEQQGFNTRSMAPGIYLNGGTLGSVVAVPEPAPLPWMIGGVLPLILLRRRQKSAIL